MTHAFIMPSTVDYRQKVLTRNKEINQNQSKLIKSVASHTLLVDFINRLNEPIFGNSILEIIETWYTL